VIDVQPAVKDKLDPALRVVANSSTEVNARRAEHAAAVAVTEGTGGRRFLRGQGATPITAAEVRRKDLKVGDLTELPDTRVSVFVHLADDVNGLADDVDGRRKGNLVTAEMAVSDVVKLPEQDANVAFVELGQPLEVPTPEVTHEAQPGLAPTNRKVGRARLHKHGAGVLVGVIDAGGFDFAHADFLDGDGTRFVSIWDQGGDSALARTPKDHAPGRTTFDYGVELTHEDLDAAIAASRQPGMPAAWELEPQSQMSPGAHATHVTSIAAGNRGIAPGADIAAVLISIPDGDLDRRKSFYDSSRIAHAFDYLVELAEQRGQPLSINISLGTNGHAHDDSAAITRWIDSALARPGRSVCVAAGNAGQERGESADDLGWIMGRVHSSGRIAAADLSADIEWNVVGNGRADVSENEMEIWYGAQDRFAVQVQPPGGDWTAFVEPGQYIENRQLPDGTFLSVYNELYHPANGCNYVAVYASPFMDDEHVVGVTAGQWIVRLVGREVRDGGYHAWIERDDPRKLGRVGEREAWVFPSFFSERSFVDNSTVSSLACGQRIVSVANADEEHRRINISSSQGPTRDGRQKPDIAAAGTDIVAAEGFTDGAGWIGMTGTSMASPKIAGVVALMLATNPNLTAAQIGGIVRATSHPLPGHDYAWRDDAGSGLIDPQTCVGEAHTMQQRRELK
jgi:subtilisin family serine protease